MTKQFYIYKMYFPANGKCYIGQTIDLKARMIAHLYDDMYIDRALRKHKEWTITVLHTCSSRDIANTLEIEEIRNHNSMAPNGYNLTAGGGCVNFCPRIEETKESATNRLAEILLEQKEACRIAKIPNSGPTIVYDPNSEFSRPRQAHDGPKPWWTIQ